MSTERQSPRPSRETRRLTAARALTESHLYRPGAALAVASALAPGLLAVAGAAVSLALTHTIPVLLPLLLLLWVPVLPVAWLTLVSVRTTATGIAVARPWRRWAELPWGLIERAERRGLRYVLTTSDGRRVAFVPALLREGGRLRREILVRLPPQVLDERLRAAGRDLLGEPLRALPAGDPIGEVRARPRLLWRGGALCGALAGGGVVSAGALALPAPVGLLGVGLGLLVVAAAAASLWWLNQEVVATVKGIQVAYALRGPTPPLTWDAIQLIEHTQRERVLRLRGEGRLTCAGPGLLRPADRDALRAFLHAYCVERGVPLVERRWLL
jgi:hypothetical protein